MKLKEIFKLIVNENTYTVTFKAASSNSAVYTVDVNASSSSEAVKKARQMRTGGTLRTPNWSGDGAIKVSAKLKTTNKPVEK